MNHHPGHSGRKPKTVPRLLTVAAGLAVIMFLMSGCSTSSTPDPSEASSASTARGQQVGPLLLELSEVVGDDADLKVDDAREETCLRPENDAPQTKTRWVGLATAAVKGDARSKAHHALDRIDQHLQADGWEKKNEVKRHEGEARMLFFGKGDLGVTAELRNGSKYAKPSMEVFVSTPCIDQPVEHRMQRSELDPGYGKSS
ncbi:MAG: hypothetical protein L0J68_07655, partial [Micrococcaceae bacterium]|nr:hypothetical protein [Micrococcaceae bacterium]MDN5880085.1 hypothetical protein [Micrococcaceae bacterium]MDN5905666.1 hypothetical protein [Micrococcaceae bacterium]MDN6168843.1 hypothetical protein [Micrococcaceae bacterium]MDN6177328.1 hypothetical protein [Micrococcaceae bacterium]